MYLAISVSLFSIYLNWVFVCPADVTISLKSHIISTFVPFIFKAYIQAYVNNHLTPFSRVFTQMLVGPHLANKFSSFYVIQKFLTVSHKIPPLVPVLSQRRYSTTSQCIALNSVLLVSSSLCLGLPSGCLASFPIMNANVSYPSHLPSFDLCNCLIFGTDYKSWSYLLWKLLWPLHR